MEGTGTEFCGIVRVYDGNVYLDEVSLSAIVNNFKGRYVEGKLFAPDKPDYPIDPLIAPLVEVLQKAGVETVASCEGHPSGRGRIFQVASDRPYVVCVAVPDWLHALLPAGWDAVWEGKFIKIVPQGAGLLPEWQAQVQQMAEKVADKVNRD